VPAQDPACPGFPLPRVPRIERSPRFCRLDQNETVAQSVEMQCCREVMQTQMIRILRIEPERYASSPVHARIEEA
jgi:hypothetical protein